MSSWMRREMLLKTRWRKTKLLPVAMKARFVTYLSPPASRSVLMKFQIQSSQVQVESSDDETTAARRKDPNAITQEEEDEFNRELAKMMINSGGDNRKAPDRKPALMDVGVPVLRRTKRGWIEAEEEERKKECEGGLTFTLLTKKGTKQQVRSF